MKRGGRTVDTDETFPHRCAPLDFALVDSFTVWVHGRTLLMRDNSLSAHESLDSMVERERYNVIEEGRNEGRCACRGSRIA